LKFIFKFILHLIIKIAGQDGTKKIIIKLSELANLDLLVIALNKIGILKYQNSFVTGEQFLISNVIKKYLKGIMKPVFFDVGANVGEYSKLLKFYFPESEIFAFEPIPNTYSQLLKNFGNYGRCVNAGMGAEEKTATIFTYSDNLMSQHASLYEEIFNQFHKRSDLIRVDFELTTIDFFCNQENITNIDFLKIDTEGNELSVLLGAKRMLSEGKIKIIQFEFGECDVFSKVFLRDFYNLLTDFNIYRLDTNQLINLFDYSVENEIFHFQNFIAVKKNLYFCTD
jgi:FkbM family methyltransferase